MRTMREHGEDESESRYSVGADGPETDDNTIAGRLKRTCQRPTVQLPPVVGHRRKFVDLDVSLVTRQRGRHFVVLPANVHLNATVAYWLVRICRFDIKNLKLQTMSTTPTVVT